MMLRGFILEPGETPRDAVYRIASDCGIPGDGCAIAAVLEYDARLALGHPPHLAALETLQEFGLDETLDTEELLKGDTNHGRCDEPV